MPSEIVSTTASSVDAGTGAVLVPESTAVVHCAVVVVGRVRPAVVVTVVRGEHHIVVSSKSITSVTRVPGHLQLVAVHLAEYDERTVLGPVPEAMCLQVEPHFVAAVLRQLM